VRRAFCAITYRLECETARFRGQRSRPSQKHPQSSQFSQESATIRYRAITSPALQQAAYALIIAADILTALLCWIGAGHLLARLRAGAAAFNGAKGFAVAGLLLGLLVWQVGFISIAGEWFGMWMSQTWNGIPSAFRLVAILLGTLIFVALPDGEVEQQA
jgi:predicted small integral membrane protein